MQSQFISRPFSATESARRSPTGQQADLGEYAPADWRTKGVEPWARTWFSDRVTGVEADGVEITELTDSEGTAELGMRKSKLITVYDLRLTMAWKGKSLATLPRLSASESSNPRLTTATAKDGEVVTGTLVAP